MADFLGIERLSLGPWQALERGLERLLIHAGFDDVRMVGGSGDFGADVIGEFKGRTWVAQAKYRGSGQLLHKDPIDEVTVAIGKYGAHVGLVATNTGYASEAVAYASKRAGDIGVPIYLWNHDEILARFRGISTYPPRRDDPRDYQEAAIDAINDRVMQGSSKALLLMATGLGKSRVAAGVIEQWLLDRPGSEVLILVPTLNLVGQLERSLWPYLAKGVATHQLTGTEKPTFEADVTVATEQSALNADHAPGRFGLVIVDEAHHAPADGYRVLLNKLGPLFLLGMTATPWRGDEQSLVDIFGDPTYSVSIVEGMQKGYLAAVDYRMLIDNIDWEYVQSALSGSVSIRELNRRLFIPERDEAVIAKIRDHIAETPDPKCIIFCRSIEHATRVSELLKADGMPNRLVHSRLDRVDTTNALREFRSGVVPTIVTVDMLNEGVDIPDVNLIVFLRVTHSRRIFVQQLGRGLRIAPGKRTVRVLDFVSDIRRIAAGIELNREAAEVAEGEQDAVLYRARELVTFEGDEGVNFFDEYLRDVAALEDSPDEARLKFPAN